MKIKRCSLKELANYDDFVKCFIITSDDAKKLSYAFIYVTWEYLEHILFINPAKRDAVNSFIDKQFEEWEKSMSEDQIFKKKNYYCTFGISKVEIKENIRQVYPDHRFE